MDSLSLVEVRNAMNVSFGLELSATILFDYPTIAQLATHIFGVLNGPPISLASAKIPLTTSSKESEDTHASILRRVAHIAQGVLGPLTPNQVCIFHCCGTFDDGLSCTLYMYVSLRILPCRCVCKAKDAQH